MIDSLRRRWWLAIGPPVVVFLALLMIGGDRPYESTVRATILIPGDTEIPGNSERPELMVLDDGPELVGSRVFAEAVAAALPTEEDLALSVGDVEAALSGERYSRILTVRARRDDPVEARAIAEAVAAVLPDTINRYLIADGAPPATVRVIDPPSEPARAGQNWPLTVLVVTLVALGTGAGAAILAYRFELGARSDPPGGSATGPGVTRDRREVSETAGCAGGGRAG